MPRLLPALVLFCSASPALAGLSFCNETATEASVAIGYSEDGVWTSEGWWRVQPFDCTSVVQGTLTKRYYYWRATVKGEAYLTESYYFCTSPQVFTIAGDTDCAARGYERHPFAAVDTGDATDWIVTLDEAAFGGPIPGEYDDAPAFDDVPLHSADEMPAPGTHGEPYRIAGILSHCDVFDASMACEIHADGWRYVANSNDPTPQWLLEELLNLPVNTPIAVSGDLMFYQGLSAEVTIRDYDLTGDDPHAALRAGLQGLWQSTEDPNFQVLIHGGIFEDLYAGQPGDAFMLQLADTCDGAYEDGPAMILHPLYGEDDEPQCYIVYDAGARLRVFPIGTMGELTFARVN